MARNKYPETTVEKILDVAERLFVECGYEHTTMIRRAIRYSWSCSGVVGMLVFRGAVVRGPASVVRLFCRV